MSNDNKTGFIIAIDPGNELSGYVILDISKGFPGELVKFGKVSEYDLKGNIYFFFKDALNAGVKQSEIHTAIEMVASYGMAVGQTIFDTCAVIGRLEQYITTVSMASDNKLNKYGLDKNIHRVYRKRVSSEGINSTTMELCNTTKAKDSNIRQAILDLYPSIGGGKTPQVGTKKEPGPLYGISGDAWQALGIGLTLQKWLEK